MVILLWGDFSAVRLRVAERRTTDAAQLLRLLLLVAVYDGVTWTEVAMGLFDQGCNDPRWLVSARSRQCLIKRAASPDETPHSLQNKAYFPASNRRSSPYF